jgi:hypothetical protein
VERALFVSVALLLIFAGCDGMTSVGLTPGAALEADMILAAEPPSGARPAIADEAWVTRYAPLRMNLLPLEDGGAAAGDTLRARLFDGEVVLLRFVARGPMAGRLNVRADLLPPETGHLLLSLADGAASGALVWGSRGQTLRVHHGADPAGHVLLEVDPDLEDVLPGAMPLVPPEPPAPGGI